jgi:transketolase
MDKWHQSQRGYFAGALYERMLKNDKLFVLVGDLGYGAFDKIRDAFPDRFVNCGASEQAMVGIACGMTYKGITPIVYSITPFLLARPYEWLRNYVNKESLPVKLVGAGRDKDYKDDGFTHYADDAMKILNTLPNIVQFYPSEKEDVVNWIDDFLNTGKPSFISLRR